MSSLLIGGVVLPSPAQASLHSDPLVTEGKQVFDKLGCGACHMQGGSAIAPSLDGIYGKSVELADGRKVMGDDSYLRRSILEPHGELVKGYAAAMPSFQALVNESELDALLAYVKSLSK